jgi:class 3 adenylate cyclase
VSATPAVWKRIRLVTTAGNLLGALLTFSYFRFIDLGVASPPVGPWEIVFSIVAFATLSGVAYVISRRWTEPLWVYQRRGGPLSGSEAARLQSQALRVPYAVAFLTAIGWILAGLIWGAVWPLLAGTFALETALRTIFGITVLAGSVATALSFFAVEYCWRDALPIFFPRGELSRVPNAPRLSVRTRLLGIFLLISVIPLAVLGVLAYTRAVALVGVAPATAAVVVQDLRSLIFFVLAAGILAAVGLAMFATHSVADPLGRVEDAMAAVGRGDLDGHCAVVTNDELGSVAEGFNRMLHGLREREVIRETFGKYVTREVRDEILAGRASFDGQLEEVTILFADLRDFTPWVERTEPREVVRDLNGYFTEMEAAVRGQRGLVLQFIGDEIEAVFGAPLRAPDHADRAVAAARDMRRRLAELNARRARDGKGPLRNGIGIHSGTVLAGNIGSSERLTYALVGDAVNLASRIQGLNKELGTDLLLSDATRKKLTRDVTLEALPAARVKGKSVEVSVYRVREPAQ